MLTYYNSYHIRSYHGRLDGNIGTILDSIRINDYRCKVDL